MYVAAAVRAVRAHRARGVGGRRAQQALRVRRLPGGATHAALLAGAVAQGTRQRENIVHGLVTEVRLPAFVKA